MNITLHRHIHRSFLIDKTQTLIRLDWGKVDVKARKSPGKVQSDLQLSYQGRLKGQFLIPGY